MDKYPDRLVVLYNLAEDMSLLKKRFAFTIPRLKKSITAKFLNKDDRQTESENDQYIGYNIYHYDLPLIQFVLKMKCQAVSMSLPRNFVRFLIKSLPIPLEAMWKTS